MKEELKRIPSIPSFFTLKMLVPLLTRIITLRSFLGRIIRSPITRFLSVIRTRRRNTACTRKCLTLKRFMNKYAFLSLRQCSSQKGSMPSPSMYNHLWRFVSCERFYRSALRIHRYLKHFSNLPC